MATIKALIKICYNMYNKVRAAETPSLEETPLHEPCCTYRFVGYCDCGEAIERLPAVVPWPTNLTPQEEEERIRLLEKSEYTLGRAPIGFHFFDPGVYGDIDAFFTDYVDSGIAAKEYEYLINKNTEDFHRKIDVNIRNFEFPVIQVNGNKKVP